MKTKKAFLLILMSALGLLNAYSQLPSYVPSNGLVGYWPFNGNANDESGNGNNGFVNKATLITDRFGNGNAAYLFTNNGILQNIQTNYVGVIGQNNRSISLWYKQDQISTTEQQVLCGYGSGMQAASFAPTTLSGRIGLDVSNIRRHYSLSIPSQWNNVVFVYESGNSISNVKVYLNGVLQTTAALIIGDQSAPLNTISGVNFRINASNLEQMFIGVIDDIGIWNRALSQQEIITLYNSCNTPIATITPQGNTTFCQGGSVNLNASTGVNYTYEWYNNGNIINNATSSVYNATTSGDYTVKVTDGACNATSSAQTVTVNTNPSVSLNTLNNVVFKTSLPITLVGNPTGGTYSGDAVSGSTFTPANATLGKKTFSYNYTSPQGCSGNASQTTIVTDSVGKVCSTYDTLKIKVKFTAGLYANTINTIKFYPNPTKDVLFIDNGNYQAMSEYSIKIVSLAGTVIYNQPITSQQVQISMNQFATKGLYIAQIIDSNNAIVDSKKIVLE